jgi:pimeloyl-ACP methyl ester carboxylesterase
LSTYSGLDQSVKTIAEDVVTLMSQLCLDATKTVLVGHSMGGMVACELASVQRYAGMVLLGPIHPAPGLADVFAARIKKVQECK